MTTLIIKDIIGTPNAILQKFGLLLFDTVEIALTKNSQVTVSFKGIENVTSGFMNASFGKLYKKYNVELDNRLALIDLTDSDWKEKLEDARQLALNPEKGRMIDQAIADLFE